MQCSNEAAISSNTVQIVKNHCTMYTGVAHIGTLSLTSTLGLQCDRLPIIGACKGVHNLILVGLKFLSFGPS